MDFTRTGGGKVGVDLLKNVARKKGVQRQRIVGVGQGT